MDGKSDYEDDEFEARPIVLVDYNGDQRTKIIRTPNRLIENRVVKDALTEAGARDEYVDGKYGKYVFRYEPFQEWYRNPFAAQHRDFDYLKKNGARLQVSLLDSNGNEMSFKQFHPKDDIASALRLFKGDVAAAAEYLKGQQ
jgi:hypothetical protein